MATSKRISLSKFRENLRPVKNKSISKAPSNPYRSIVLITK